MPRRRSAKRRSAKRQPVRRTSKRRSARRSTRRSARRSWWANLKSVPAWRPWAFGEMPERYQVVGLPPGTMADWGEPSPKAAEIDARLNEKQATDEDDEYPMARKWTPEPPERGPSGRKAEEGIDYTKQEMYMKPLRPLPTGGFQIRGSNYRKEGNIPYPRLRDYYPRHK